MAFLSDSFRRLGYFLYWTFAKAVLVGLARCPLKLFQGSLIPQTPCVVWRAVIQSASRGGVIVRYMTDYRMAIKWISAFSCRKISVLSSRTDFDRQKGAERIVTHNCFLWVKNGGGSDIIRSFFQRSNYDLCFVDYAAAIQV